MMGWGAGWYGMILGPLIMIVILAALISVVVLLVRWVAGPWHSVEPPRHGPPARTPLDLLKERYARGELNKEEFEERRHVLGDRVSSCSREEIAVKILFILNDPPYGTERCYNALRLALALQKKEPATQLSVFLMADAVVAARRGQKTPDGYYNLERMLKRVLAGKGQVLLCGTCMDARGLTEAELMEGSRR
ncbi:DsrE family protein, partial [mine drainage metagenome]